MIVVSMTKCPPKLRGDLSKWLLEINTGVYVGQVSARVREALWKRICENIGDGQATMVFSTNNEQHMDFYVHNTTWKPVDFDGIKLMKRPLTVNFGNGTELQSGFSNAAKRRMGQRRRRFSQTDSYMVMWAEINSESNVSQIVIHKYTDNDLADEFIFEIDDVCRGDKSQIREKLKKLLKFAGDETVYTCSNENNLDILENFLKDNGFCLGDLRFNDLSLLAELKLSDSESYSFEALVSYFAMELGENVRDKCRIVNEIYHKLNEK